MVYYVWWFGSGGSEVEWSGCSEV